MCVFVYVYGNRSLRMCMFVHVYRNRSLRMCVCVMYIEIGPSMCVHVYRNRPLRICMCVYIYIYTVTLQMKIIIFTYINKSSGIQGINQWLGCMYKVAHCRTAAAKYVFGACFIFYVNPQLTRNCYNGTCQEYFLLHCQHYSPSLSVEFSFFFTLTNHSILPSEATTLKNDSLMVVPGLS